MIKSPQHPGQRRRRRLHRPEQDEPEFHGWCMHCARKIIGAPPVVRSIGLSEPALLHPHCENGWSRRTAYPLV